MKTKEFIQKVEELGYTARKRIDKHIFEIIFNENQAPISIADISIDRPYSMNTHNLDDFDKQGNLFKMLSEYAETPLQDREEEKIYLVKVPNNWRMGNYFTKSNNGIGLNLGLITSYSDGTYFTEDEIKHYHLENFKKAEVK